MGLTTEIEQIFQEALELDLKRISRGALPSSHWTNTPPMSMFRVQEQQSVSGAANLSVSLGSVDYQIVRIELDPLEANPQSRLPQIKDRRAHRKTQPSLFEDEYDRGVANPASAQQHFDSAHDHYIVESKAKGPIEIIPQSLNIDGSGNVETPPYLIRVGGVDYVREDIINNVDGAVYEKLKISADSNANVDQWPEEVVLRGNTHSDPDHVYVRFDVGFLKKDAAGQWQKKFIRLRTKPGE